MQNMADDVLFIDNSNNIKLINFKATHIEPKGPVGCTGNVIHIENGSDITIEDCDLNGSGIVGIAAYGTKDLKVINNYIHENSQYGIIYQGPQIEIKGNRFQDNANGNIYFSYQSITWPPDQLINSNQNSKGLTMSSNTFIE
jgi:parallel beta-helix repeat protein